MYPVTSSSPGADILMRRFFPSPLRALMRGMIPQPASNLHAAQALAEYRDDVDAIESEQQTPPAPAPSPIIGSESSLALTPLTRAYSAPEERSPPRLPPLPTRPLSAPPASDDFFGEQIVAENEPFQVGFTTSFALLSLDSAALSALGPLVEGLEEMLRRPSHKDKRFGRTLVERSGLIPLGNKDLSEVRLPSGRRYLITPTLCEDAAERGAYGKVRLGIDEAGHFVFGKEVRSGWREIIRVLLGHAPREAPLLSTEAPEFVFELSAAKLCTSHFELMDVARLRGKLLALMSPYPAGSLARPRAIPQQLFDVFVLSVLHDVSRDLARAHALNLVHRDLRTANVLVHRDGFALCDFGSIYAVRDPAWQSERTAAHPAPELFDPQRRLDTRVDIWALGHLALELCAPGGMAWLPAPYDRQHPQVHFEALETWRQFYLNDPERALRGPREPDAHPLEHHYSRYFRQAHQSVPLTTDVLLRCLLVKEPSERPNHAGAVQFLVGYLLNQQPQELRDGVAQLRAQWHDTPGPLWSFWQQRLMLAYPAWRDTFMLLDESAL